MKQYTKLIKDAVAEIELIEEAHLNGLSEKVTKARVFVETEKELPEGKAIKFKIEPPGKDETYIAYGVIDKSCGQSSGKIPRGVAVSVLEIERSSSEGETEGALGSRADPSEAALEMPISLPDAKKIKGMLDSLMGLEVEIEESESDPSNGPKAVTTFIADSGAIGAVCICDIGIASKIGAALENIPPEEVEQIVQSGEIPENIINNFKEAMNVSASLFNSENSTHLSSGEVLINPEKLNANISIVINKASSKATYKVTIPNYGDGLMALYSAP